MCAGLPGDAADALFVQQMTADAAFLTWAESSGRSLIAQELRSLRGRAAAGSVQQVWELVRGVLCELACMSVQLHSLRACSCRMRVGPCSVPVRTSMYMSG